MQRIAFITITRTRRAAATECCARIAVFGHTLLHSIGIGPSMNQVAHKRARIHVPEHGNLVPVQIKLGRFPAAPIRGNLRKLTHNERFDVRPRRFFIVEIGADVADVRIGEAHGLPGVTRVGENFLVPGEAGIENDFAAAARNRAGRAAIKDAPVFQREGCGAVRNFRQCVLPGVSSGSAIHLVLASVVESEPK